jgi:hypothetical protein
MATTSQLLEAPAQLTREDIVNALCQSTEQRLEELRRKLKLERDLLVDPSEVDRDAQALHRREVGKTIAQIEGNIENLSAFQDWLSKQEHAAHDPFAVGNIWVLDDGNKREMWLIFDPRAPRPGSEISVSFGEEDLLAKLGTDGLFVMSYDCPLLNRIREMGVNEGANVIVSVDSDADDDAIRGDNVSRLQQIL